MTIKDYQNDLMFKIKPNILRGVFNNLSLNFGNSRKASDFLLIPYSSFRAYHNGYIQALPERLFKKIIKTKVISEKEFTKNIISSYYRHEQNTKILNSGRIKRICSLKKWKREIPSLKDILGDNKLFFERWFFSYLKLINFGVRKINFIKKYPTFLEVGYTTHSNKSKKDFVLMFPREIVLDQKFIYFFGLWCGDKAGGKRFGIMNQESAIVNFSKEYLLHLSQKPEIVLYIAKNQKIPYGQQFDKIVKINNKTKGYAFSTHSINGIMASFFNYLESNLDEFLEEIDKPNLFFAGLFDAEGNVFLEDSCFRWACKNKELVRIFEKHLTKLGLFKRYDGSNLVAYNKEIFAQKILPYIIHPVKINNSNLVCYNKGRLDERFENILKIIESKPGITNKELTKVLKRKKSYAQVRVLEKLGYIYSKNYPKQLFTNNKFNIVNKQ